MSDDEIAKAAEWAELPLNVEELALLIGIEKEQLMLALSSDENKLGVELRLAAIRSKAELYESIMRSAKQGSGPAQLLAIALIQKSGR